jgi:hypothetical protein
VVAAAGVEEAAAVVVLGAGAVAVVEEDVGRWLSRRLLTCLLTCLGIRHLSPSFEPSSQRQARFLPGFEFARITFERHNLEQLRLPLKFA